MHKLFVFALIGALAPWAAVADLPVRKVAVTDWKAVFGRVEARDTVPARSRIGGTLEEILIEEGDLVERGQQIGLIHDPKLDLQMQAVEAQIEALQSQLENAKAELARGEGLLERGVTTQQRLDQLRTQVEVLVNQIEAQEAQKRVIEEQAAEGAVLAPISGRVVSVPVTEGSVLMPGEPVANVAGGGFFLRLAVPERHARFLKEGVQIRMGKTGEGQPGRIAKVYPQIENGRVIADVEVEGLSSEFINARVLVSLPVAKSEAIVVPASAVTTRMGLDFVTVKGADGEPVDRAVVVGERHEIEGVEMIEILSGLTVQDVMVTGHE
ncbi:efflux RND transporter periplasmic adaptor subunit [Jhaorihella thermophila]|uniref:RND family efflux transporter, MFP subunit n=1 Tax=Jhaorihella thermophila TaxID=488547 RepID=A0A1H5XKW2_9RHOB|nr:efflux RND transporter periplasmic adaptor subunit [Jhaorihella thermophila]SEG12404.1 RND family efflux transporter, MFP subunit [Jhaorihella thermophila]